MSKHRGKEITEWLDILIRKAKETEMSPKNRQELKLEAKDISFSSKKFKAKNIQEALDESRGLVLNQFDLLSQSFNKEVTVRQLLTQLTKMNKYEFNMEMLKMFEENKPAQISSVNDALDELLKLLFRSFSEIDKLKKEIDRMKLIEEKEQISERG